MSGAKSSPFSNMVDIYFASVTGERFGETVDCFATSSQELRPEEEIGR
jgi:hypothetical protein